MQIGCPNSKIWNILFLFCFLFVCFVFAQTTIKIEPLPNIIVYIQMIP